MFSKYEPTRMIAILSRNRQIQRLRYRFQEM